ncbi:FAD/NAD(P)-binding protein [Pseudomonas sp.]|uniref:FAD/NAD(P)-binding protein n=1 Tax=Pseudomonas sp. TaxID=306 RepID=UPI00258584F6|nr:FAD/NAD(P)-binding protein [Pseudomonas sp.]
MKTLVIIGSGFSGTVTAIEFLKRRGREIKVIIINRSGLMARGLAYGTRSAHHLLNVPAGNMSALVNDSSSFLNYCKTFDGTATASSFMPRQLYGQYLNELLLSALKACPLAEHRVGEVTYVEPCQNGARVHLVGDEVIQADHVVMAVGNFSPVTPHVLRKIERTSRYHADPWNIEDLHSILSNQVVLLLGSGLTALDMLTNLVQKGHRGPIYMLSRRGLLPINHRMLSTGHTQIEGVYEALAKEAPKIRRYLRVFRNIAATEASNGHDWRDVLASLRPVTPELWRRLPVNEQKRFLRHVQPYWDVHRHRVAPATYATFLQAIDSRQLKPLAGRLSEIESTKGGLNIHFQRRNTLQPSELFVHHVINCTGPNSNLSQIEQPFIKRLIDDGTLRADAHGLGMIVNTELAVIDNHGMPSPWLSYVGPMLKATFWEATAVPELKVHSHRLATRLANQL